ncbi:hypothetical protein SNE40_006780 [Patella caerulea]|uniref:beta-glucosidase n=1 Tax=Patella caerulea TaxID=87958 RepID=A0AAN8JY93_PATCE
MLSRVKYVYDNPSVYVTDISQSGANISGDMESKIDYYRIYTNNILKAVNLDECNIKGFSVGSLLDGPTGLKDNYHSYGLYEVDFNHPERKRTARGTAHWFSLLATENAFTPGYSKPGGWGIAPKNVDQFHIDKFPEEFMFGAATSAAQVEGGWDVDGKGASIWDTFANADKVKDKSTPQIACDSYHNYKQDIVLLKQLGVKFYRFSIAWPRIMPDGITRNDKGIEYYHNLIDELKMNQIIPMVTIYHWDLPQSLENYGGWLNSSIVDRFRNYAHLLFEEYGGKVDWWITLNEPWVFVVKGYGNGEFAPGISDDPGRKPYIAAHNAIKAHAEAYHDYHDNYKGKGKIGITLNIDWQEPKDPYNPDDIEASEWAIQTFLGWFAHPVYINGDYPDVMKTKIATISTEQGLGGSRLPEFTAAEKARINGTSDFFGINSYSTNLAYKDDPSRAGKEAPDYFKDRGILSDFDPSWPGSGSTWLKVVPWGLRKILNWVKNNYGDREILITENGVSDNTGTLQDSQRAAFIRNYINEVLKAVKYDGINVIGYTAWSLMDNFEWQSGYTERFGLYHVDFEDANRTRTPKSSAQEFHKIIVDHGFTTESKAEPYHPSPLPYQDTFYYKQQFPKDFSWGVTSQYFQGGFGWDTTVNGTSLDVLINGVDLKPDTDTSGLYRVVFNRLNNVDEGRKHVEATHVYTSILWPVMFPNRTIQDVDKTTLIAMRSFLKELPVGNTTITIFTWDLPNIMDTKNNGGWLNESNIDIFVEIARIYFDALGDTVKQWVTFNEPQQYAYLMYESGQLPPYHGNRTNDMYKAMHNMIKAHARVYHMYQKDFKRRQQGKVGLIVRNDWYIPKDSNNPADNDAVLRNLEFEYFWFSDPIFRTGDYPDEMKQHVGGTRLPSFTPREKQLNLGACDFLGINHYGSLIVKTRQPGDAPNGFNEDKGVTTDNNRYNELVIDPTGIRKMLNVIKGRYGKIPIYIAGNGITDTQKTHSNIDRATYIKQYSNEVLKAILHDQVNVKGYSYSRVLDGYSWTSPSKGETGLFYKPSAFTRPREGMQAFKDLVTFNGYVDPPKETTTPMRSTTPNNNNNNNNNNNPDKPVNNATRYISNVYFHLLITVFVISKLIA